LAGVLGAALVVRVAMLASALSRIDGDEAVTGIMAQRINEGHHLAFFAGQAYQGSGEQYLQALLFRVLRETPFTLRIPQVALGVLACAGVYLLARRCLRSEGRALVAAALFAVGPFFSVWWSVKSRGAYDSALVVGLGGLLVALWVQPDDRRAAAKLGLFGLICGLGFWANWQAAYLLLPAGLWLAGTLLGWRLLRALPAAVVGFVIGAAPSIGHLILTGPLEAAGTHAPSTLGTRAKLVVTSVVPQFLGVQIGEERVVSWFRPAVATVVIGVALALALWFRRRGLLDLATLRRPRREPVDLLLVCAVLTPVLYAQSSAAVNKFPGYMYPLYAVVPVLVAAVPMPQAIHRRRRVPATMAAGLVVAVAGLCWLTAHEFWGRGEYVAPLNTGERIPTDQLPAVVDALVAEGARSVFADYWIANPMQFLAGDRLVVSSTSTYRFPSITAAARADPSPALVVPAGSRADALRTAIIAAGSTARERRIKDLVLYTGIRPGLAPTETIVMDGALQPAPLLRP
jgi:4-amino-4-deoxy-L-arabinose transferase-like glycosyltransferase